MLALVLMATGAGTTGAAQARPLDVVRTYTVTYTGTHTAWHKDLSVNGTLNYSDREAIDFSFACSGKYPSQATGCKLVGSLDALTDSTYPGSSNGDCSADVTLNQAYYDKRPLIVGLYNTSGLSPIRDFMVSPLMMVDQNYWDIHYSTKNRNCKGWFGYGTASYSSHGKINIATGKGGHVVTVVKGTAGNDPRTQGASTYRGVLTVTIEKGNGYDWWTNQAEQLIKQWLQAAANGLHDTPPVTPGISIDATGLPPTGYPYAQYDANGNITFSAVGGGSQPRQLQSANAGQTQTSPLFRISQRIGRHQIKLRIQLTAAGKKALGDYAGNATVTMHSRLGSTHKSFVFTLKKP